MSKKELIRGLPKLKFELDKVCDACQLGKQHKSSFKLKDAISTSKPLELLHLYLFGPTKTSSLGGRRYCLVIVDDYSRFTWVYFLTHKDETLYEFKKFSKRVCNEKGFCIVNIRSDHDGEFQIIYLKNLC